MVVSTGWPTSHDTRPDGPRQGWRARMAVNRSESGRSGENGPDGRESAQIGVDADAHSWYSMGMLGSSLFRGGWVRTTCRRVLGVHLRYALRSSPYVPVRHLSRAITSPDRGVLGRASYPTVSQSVAAPRSSPPAETEAEIASDYAYAAARFDGKVNGTVRLAHNRPPAIKTNGGLRGSTATRRRRY